MVVAKGGCVRAPLRCCWRWTAQQLHEQLYSLISSVPMDTRAEEGSGMVDMTYPLCPQELQVPAVPLLSQLLMRTWAPMSVLPSQV